MKTRTRGLGGAPAAGSQRVFGGGTPNAAAIFSFYFIFLKNNPF